MVRSVMNHTPTKTQKLIHQSLELMICNNNLNIKSLMSTLSQLNFSQPWAIKIIKEYSLLSLRTTERLLLLKVYTVTDSALPHAVNSIICMLDHSMTFQMLCLEKPGIR